MTPDSQYAITYLDALECVIGGEPTAIALDVAGQVVEYVVSPLPLASEQVLGIGVLKGRLVVSLGIEPTPAPGPRHTTAVLLDLPGAKESFAVEVGRVVGFVRVLREDGAHTSEGHPTVTTADGRRIRWFDVLQMFGPLTATTRARSGVLSLIGAPR